MKDDLTAGFDELFEDILRTLPYSLHAYYKKLLIEGFNEEQAFILVRDYQKYILTTGMSQEEDEEK